MPPSRIKRVLLFPKFWRYFADFLQHICLIALVENQFTCVGLSTVCCQLVTCQLTSTGAAAVQDSIHQSCPSLVIHVSVPYTHHCVCNTESGRTRLQQLGGIKPSNKHLSLAGGTNRNLLHSPYLAMVGTPTITLRPCETLICDKPPSFAQHEYNNRVLPSNFAL